MSTGSIRYTKVSGVDVERIISKIEPHIEGEQRSHIMMACLIVAIGMLKPDITLDKLVEGVKGASEWISLFVADTSNEGEEGPVTMN